MWTRVGVERRLQAMRHQQVEPVVAHQAFGIDDDIAERVAQLRVARR